MIPFFRGDIATPHGFFTRKGGVSEGAYSSLNCSVFGKDDPEHVAENRLRAARAIGATPSSLTGVRQVHGARVITVASPLDATAGIEADAMVTDQ
ncbi:MAG TPA: laccase domain-containing protein, partial [Acidiphilium sp.]